MSEATRVAWLVAGLNLVPTLLWTIICERTWWILRTRSPQSRLYMLLPLLTGAVALHYFLSGLKALYPEPAGAPPLALCLLGALRDLSLLAAVVVGRHLLRYFSDDEDTPSRAWLAANYGSAAAVCVVVLYLSFVSHYYYRIVYEGFLFLYLVLIVVYAARAARRGPWGHAGLTAIRSADVALFTSGLFGSAVLLHLAPFGEGPHASEPLWVSAMHVVIGLAVAVPFAVRMLGEVLRTFLLALSLAAVTFALYFGLGAIFARAPADLEQIGHAVILLSLLLLLGPGQRWLREVIDRLGFRRTRRREAQLHAVLHTLSPELGAAECCRRALAEFVQVVQARGAAVLLTDGSAVVQGGIEIRALQRVWPLGPAADSLYRAGFGLLEMRELPRPLREPLLAANVVGAFPIVSPRRRWGHLFLTSGILGTVITDEDGEVIQWFTDQLALVLDGTELLGRVVTIERSLAHAEKLSAIGELAARVAHEIRNPVTAARSLAQSLCREPTSPLNTEHAGLILGELERVERQIAALLRFARREDLQLEAVDLGALARETLGQLHPRLEGAGIAFDLEAAEGVIARVDREKIRQVLINLIENSIDALADAKANGDRRIALRVARENGHACVRVADTGPGVPEEFLPRIFEPFFSLKSHGTGLGLAIVKRTVEAHGGQILAAGAQGRGLALEVELPLEGHG